MATGILALLDDIAMLMDDIAVASKFAAKKTSAVLGDDIAVTAKETTDIPSSREIPIILAIIKGSFINKLIILPVVFILNYFFPWIISPILMIGGLYLAYEAGEKILEFTLQKEKHKEKRKLSEKEKIKSALKTDFILSLEIIIIALSSVKDEPLIVQIVATSIVAFLATIGVYGLVALIVRLDDIGIYLIKTGNSLLGKVGRFLVFILPWIIKFLSFTGTLAMLLVAGGIFMHNVHFLHDFLGFMPGLLSDFIVGIVLGVITVLSLKVIKRLKSHKAL